MSIFSGLLFLQGHISNVALAQRLASPVTPSRELPPAPAQAGGTPAATDAPAAPSGQLQRYQRCT